MRVRPGSQSEPQAGVKVGSGLSAALSAFEVLDPAQLTATEGGVAPMWDIEGNMIKCTDLRRWYPRQPLPEQNPIFRRLG
jgi:hypothetical protein